jgi:simple sugar transport system permease protein
MESIIIAVVRRALIAGTSLLLGTTGEIITERAGILNLGVEGMMNIGAVTGFIVTLLTRNPWLGTLAALLAGALSAFLHAFVSITLRANQVVSGLALTMVGVGIAGLVGKPFIGRPLPVKVETFRVPMLGDISVLGDILFNHDPYFYLAIGLGIAAWFVLTHTSSGIKVRSAGENPEAAESQGVSVYRVKYLCVIIGGAFAGLAGAHVSIAYSTSWTEGMVAGRGWIIVGLTIFSLWNPLRGFIGAFLFGGIFVLQYLLQPLGISPNLLATLPYLATLFVLLLDGLRKDHRNLHAPAKLGEPYKRGEV